VVITEYCSYDCGFHVLLYIKGFDKMDIYNITRVNIEPCGFKVLLYSNSRTNDLCLKNAG
jgi:hypothetical protein